jgi:beta-lactam-binding protein with PASTA domain
VAPKAAVAAPGLSPPVPRCEVPVLRGLSLTEVKSALAKADCTLGKVAHHWFSLPSGRLMEQNAHQGTILPAGAQVSVWLSRGAHPHHAGKRRR